MLIKKKAKERLKRSCKKTKWRKYSYETIVKYLNQKFQNITHDYY